MNVLLPACGFGTRNPDHPVKELIVKKGLQNDWRPLIEFSFLHLLEPSASERVKKIVIITRKEKVSAFNLWLDDFRSKNSRFSMEVLVHLHEPGESNEWPFSLLAAESLWGTKNLVLLPDTQLTLPSGLVKTFDESLDKFLTVWGVTQCKLSEVSSFGNVEKKISELFITEKPARPTSPWIWGCFGFQKQEGRKLLLNLEKSTHDHLPFRLPDPTELVELNSFKDLSRPLANP